MLQDTLDKIIDKINIEAEKHDEEKAEYTDLIEALRDSSSPATEVNILENGDIEIIGDPELIKEVLELYGDLTIDAIPLVMELYKKFDKIEKLWNSVKGIASVILDSEGRIITMAKEFWNKAETRIEEFSVKWS